MMKSPKETASQLSAGCKSGEEQRKVQKKPPASYLLDVNPGKRKEKSKRNRRPVICWM